MSPDPLRVGDLFTIPEGELQWRFDPSGGPGGQHANRSSTRVELTFDIATSEVVPDRLRTRMLRRLGGRVRDGVLRVTVDETRSQWRNRAIARRRLAELLVDSARPPRRRRRTSVPQSARRRRRDAKRRRSDLKRLRRRPNHDD